MNKVTFIGAGNMNKAIITGLVKQGFAAKNIMVSNPSAEKREAMAQQLGICQSADNIVAANFSDTIVLGVKPHFIADVCQQLAANIDLSNKTIISVAAGITIEQMQTAIAQKVAVVRCMPNTPSQIGLGMTGMYASCETTAEQQKFADTLLSSVGKVLWLDTESDIDNLLTVSGSGPAYFFAFMEAMQQQAIAFGFSEQIARELVQQTALGAAQMVVQNSESIATLRENVTSKGGATQAALAVFRDGTLADLVCAAMKAAKTRSLEMSKTN